MVSAADAVGCLPDRCALFFLVGHAFRELYSSAAFNRMDSVHCWILFPLSEAGSLKIPSKQPVAKTKLSLLLPLFRESTVLREFLSGGGKGQVEVLRFWGLV